MKQKKTNDVIIIVVSVIAAVLLIVVGILLFSKIASNGNSDKSDSAGNSDVSEATVGNTVDSGKNEQDNADTDPAAKTDGVETDNGKNDNVENDSAENDSVDWSSAYYHCITDNDRQIQTHDRWDTVVTINDDTKLALYDFDNNSIPELCIGKIGARGMGLDVFSVFDNKVVYIGGCGAGTFSYTDDNTCPGLFANYNGSYPYEYSPVGYLSIIDRTLDSAPIITYGEFDQQTKNRTTTVNDKALYQAYNGDRKNLDYYNWSKIQANGWESFISFYGYRGEQKRSVQQSQNERFTFTLGGNKVSIELPSSWHAKTTASNAGEDITFFVTETNGRDYTVCLLRCMTAAEYKRVNEWYKSFGTSFEEAAEYYGNKGGYYYAMVWLDGYGYDPETQLVIGKAMSISHDVAKTFRFGD